MKLAKQAYDIIPKMIKGGGDGVYGPAMLTAVGFPAAEGWYATIASPHMVGDTKAQQFVDAYHLQIRQAGGRLHDHRL